MTVSRRDFVKSSVLAVGALATSSLPTLVRAAERPKVYFSRELSAESLIRLYGKITCAAAKRGRKQGRGEGCRRFY